MEASLEAGGPALPSARTLARLPRGRFPAEAPPEAGGAVAPHLEAVRRVVALLRQDALCRLQAGDVRAAVASSRALLNAARAVGDEPALLAQGLRVRGADAACRLVARLLGQAEPPAADLEGLQRDLEVEDGFDGLRVGLRGHRAALQETLEAVESGRLAFRTMVRQALASRGGSDGAVPDLGRTDLLAGHALCLTLMTRCAEAAPRSRHEGDAAQQDFEAALAGWPDDAPVLQILMLDVPLLAAGCRREHAALRCAAVALAAERYRRSQGRWPQSLRQLTPSYLAEAPQDPYHAGGLPLRLEALPDGLVVFSAGPHGSDGVATMFQRERLRPNTEVFVRLWDPARRGLPPPGAGGDDHPGN
jgi:hypothetical protein